MAKSKPDKDSGSESSHHGATGLDYVGDKKFVSFVRSYAARTAGDGSNVIENVVSDEDIKSLAEHVFEKSRNAAGDGSESAGAEVGGGLGGTVGDFLGQRFNSVHSFILMLPPELKKEIADAVLRFAGLTD